jgi:hypothetical protein
MNLFFSASKNLTKLAWRIAVDAHRTLVPLEYPPHVIALASVYVAALLASFEQPLPGQHTMASVAAGSQGDSRSAHEIASLLSQGGVWEDEFHACAEDIDGMCVDNPFFRLSNLGRRDRSCNSGPTHIRSSEPSVNRVT